MLAVAAVSERLISELWRLKKDMWLYALINPWTVRAVLAAVIVTAWGWLGGPAAGASIFSGVPAVGRVEMELVQEPTRPAPELWVIQSVTTYEVPKPKVQKVAVTVRRGARNGK